MQLIYCLVFLSLSLIPVFAEVETREANKELAEVKQRIEERKSPALVLNKTVFKQGEFIVAKMHHQTYKPTVWFQGIAYRTFKTGEGQYRAILPVENLTKTGDYAVLARAGDWSEKIPVQVIDNGKGISYITLSDDKSGLSATAKELNSIGSAFKTKTDLQLWQGKFIYPCAAPKSSPFGVKRSYNKAPVSSYHKGLDFAGGMGEPVVAPADGKVIMVGHEKDGFVVHGDTVIIDHGHAITSIYMHLSKTLVSVGDTVSQGQKIGEVGHTGISTGPHLHWGTYAYGTSVDPELFVAREI